MRPRAEDLGRGASREPVTGESAEAALHTAAAGTRQHDRTTRPDNTTAAAGGRRAHRERAPDRGAGEGGQRPTYPRMGASPPPRGNQRREGAARAPGKRRGDRRSVATKGGAGGAGGTTPRGAKRGREGAEPSKRRPPKRRARRRTKERDAGASVASVSPETKDLDGLYTTCVATAAGASRPRTPKETPPSHPAERSEAATRPQRPESKKKGIRNPKPKERHRTKSDAKPTREAHRAQPPEGGRARLPKGAGAKRHGKHNGRRADPKKPKRKEKRNPILTAGAKRPIYDPDHTTVLSRCEA